jgi:hypothetical protein
MKGLSGGKKVGTADGSVHQLLRQSSPMVRARVTL